MKLTILGVQQRFYKATVSYCRGVLEQVDRESQAKIPSIEEQLETRRRSIAATPMYALLEYGDLSPYILKPLIVFRDLDMSINWTCRTRYLSIRLSKK